MVYFDQILHTYTFLHCQATGMENDDKDLLSISLACRGQFVKMSINLQIHGIFSLDFAYLIYIHHGSCTLQSVN